MTENNPHELAGATQDKRQPEPDPDTAVEIHPVSFDKDFMDFRANPRGVDETVEEVGVPKSSLAPASVEPPTSLTGLEDVSVEDLERLVPLSAAKDKNPKSSTATADGGTSPA